MKCPVCRDTNLVMSDRQGIEIDYCPECRGVWLDRGELDKIIERSVPAAPVSQPRPSSYGGERPSSHQHGQDSHYYGKKKRGGLLGDIFDF